MVAWAEKHLLLSLKSSKVSIVRKVRRGKRGEWRGGMAYAELSRDWGKPGQPINPGRRRWGHILGCANLLMFWIFLLTYGFPKQPDIYCTSFQNFLCRWVSPSLFEPGTHPYESKLLWTCQAHQPTLLFVNISSLPLENYKLVFSLSISPTPPYTPLLAKTVQCFLNQEVPPFHMTSFCLIAIVQSVLYEKQMGIFLYLSTKAEFLGQWQIHKLHG